MWRKLFLGFIVVPLGVILIALAVVNRKPAELILDPFGGSEPLFTITAPLFILMLGAFAAGLVVGGIATWLRQGKWRKTARAQSREARDWKKQAERLEQEYEPVEPASARLRLPAD